VVRVGEPQPGGVLLGAAVQLQLPVDDLAQLLVDREAASSVPMDPFPELGHGRDHPLVDPAVMGAEVAAQLPADRRRRPAQPPGDLPHTQPEISFQYSPSTASCHLRPRRPNSAPLSESRGVATSPGTRRPIAVAGTSASSPGTVVTRGGVGSTTIGGTPSGGGQAVHWQGLRQMGHRRPWLRLFPLPGAARWGVRGGLPGLRWAGASGGRDPATNPVAVVLCASCGRR
jgi:hypothetical protein